MLHFIYYSNEFHTYIFRNHSDSLFDNSVDLGSFGVSFFVLHQECSHLVDESKMRDINILLS
jgi:hypothetical protein